MIIIGWFSLDLIWAGLFLNPAINSSMYKTTMNSNNVSVSSIDGRYYWNSIQENDQRFKRFFLFKDIRPTTDTFALGDTYLPNINILSNIAMLNNFDPMVPARYATFIKELDAAPADIRNRYLEIANVGKIASVDSLDNRKVNWEMVSSKPEVRLVPCATITRNEQESLSWIRTAAEENKFDTYVAIEFDKEEQQVCDASRISGNQNIVTTNHDKGLVIEINDNPSNQWLVISRTWYPGWQARIDGVKTEIFRANYLFMGVEVPSGTHKIELFYRPNSFQIGRLLSICGILVVIVAGFISKRFTEAPIEG